MKVIVDEREHSLYEKLVQLLQQKPLPHIILSKQVLPLGDIYFKTNDDVDVLLIERKSFPDLLSSIKDGRYEEQSYRLIHSSEFPPHNIFYLIEGMYSQLYNPLDKKFILSAMTSLQFFKGFSMIRTATMSETAETILSMADKIDRDFGKGKVAFYKQSQQKTDLLENSIEPGMHGETTANPISGANYCSVVKKVKKDNITPENIGEIILCQIPGISSVTAITIMKHFPGFPGLIDGLKQNPNCLDNIVIESNGKTRKINKSSIENIRKFLLIQH
jgi:ERCC4-type nuclease